MTDTARRDEEATEAGGPADADAERRRALRQRCIDALLLLLYVPVVAHLWSQGPNRAIDSAGYWKMEPIRSPGYSLFVQPFLRSGPLHQSWALLAVQLGLGAAAILLLCAYLKRRFDLPFWFAWLVSLPLAFPYVEAGFGNQILSEGLAYPLFLLVVRFLFQAALERSVLALGLASALTVPLVLARGQFLFLYPVLGLVCAWMFVVLASRRAAVVKVGLLLVCCIVGANLLERTYHAALHGRFVSTPFSGIQLAALPFYVATARNASLFDEGKEKQFFESSFAKLTRAGLTSDSFMAQKTEGALKSKNWRRVGRPRRPPPAMRRNDPEQLHGLRGFRLNFNHYASNYNRIVHDTLRRRSEIDGLIERDQVATSTALTLIRANPRLYSKFYLMNLLIGLGGGRFAPLLLSAVALAALTARARRNAPATLVLVAGLVWMANAALVALAEPTTLSRYMVYGDVLMSVSIAIAVFWGLRAWAMRGARLTQPSDGRDDGIEGPV